MNIQTTAYNEKGTLFSFDLIVNNQDDFDRMLKVLNIFYGIQHSNEEKIEGKEENDNKNKESFWDKW